jgi:hypothetical protein
LKKTERISHPGLFNHFAGRGTVKGRDLILTALLLLTSCVNSGRQVSIDVADSIVLRANRPLPNVCLSSFCYEKGTSSYLFFDDKSNREIRIFDLNSQQELESIPIRDTGVNSIPYYSGFTIKSLDTIYLPVPDHKLYCINRKGEILKIIDYSSCLQQYPLLTAPLSISRFAKGAVIKGSEIYFILHDSRRFYFSYMPSDYHFLLKYNLKNDYVEISPISMPDNFWKDGKREMSVSMTYNDLQNTLVFGTQFSDIIYISKDGSTIDRTYHSRSKSVWKYFSSTPDDSLESQNYFYSLCKYSYNVGLIWDRYRKIYYRFVWPGMKDLDIKQTSRISEIINNFPTFTIDILDDDFNMIGSYPLPDNKYNWNNYFITKEGLFLAVNESSKDRINHQWVFHLLKVTR